MTAALHREFGVANWGGGEMRGKYTEKKRILKQVVNYKTKNNQPTKEDVCLGKEKSKVGVEERIKNHWLCRGRSRLTWRGMAQHGTAWHGMAGSNEASPTQGSIPPELNTIRPRRQNRLQVTMTTLRHCLPGTKAGRSRVCV